MKNNLRKILSISILLLGFVFVNASEISGSISSTPQTYSGQGSMSGSVSSPAPQNSGSSYGGGGSIVLPAMSYNNGENVDYNMGTINLDGKVVEPESNKVTTKAPTKKLVQADRKIESPNTDSVSTNTNANPGDFNVATLTTTTTDQDLNTTPSQNNMNQEGKFDFFGISGWFWFIVAILLALIVSVFYMQS